MGDIVEDNREQADSQVEDIQREDRHLGQEDNQVEDIQQEDNQAEGKLELAKQTLLVKGP